MSDVFTPLQPISILSTDRVSGRREYCTEIALEVSGLGDERLLDPWRQRDCTRHGSSVPLAVATYVIPANSMVPVKAPHNRS